jgi:hypothetical protein
VHKTVNHQLHLIDPETRGGSKDLIRGEGMASYNFTKSYNKKKNNF